MIKVDGYKAFRGVMKITPKCEGVPPFELEGDWLFKPEFKCWYGKGQSFPEEICEIIKEN